MSGWASWVNGEDVLIAFTQPASDEEGWARVDSGAPGASLHDVEGDLDEPETWMSFARLIHAVVTDAQADAVFDTSLVYELSVLKGYAERYLLEVSPASPAYTTAFRLRQLIDRFVAIHAEHIPPTSILREFIGDSSFAY